MFSTAQNVVVTPNEACETSRFSGTFSFHSRPPRQAGAFTFASLSMSQRLTEPRTGIAFPSEYCNKNQFRCPTLTGLGVRAKRILGVKNINVYALGVYVEAAAAKKALHHHRGDSVEELETNERLYDDVITSDRFDKSLRLVVHTDLLTRDKFMAALNDRLKPELKKEGDEGVLAQFQQQFEDIKVGKGTEIVFYQTASGGLVTHVNGTLKGTLQSPALCRSMLRIYLGADPVSPDAKKDFGRNLARMIHE